MATRLQDAPAFKGYAEEDRPLGGYVTLMSVYAALTGTFAAWFAGSQRKLPDRIAPGDMALLAVATHKSARMLAKDKVTAPARAPFTEFEEDAELPGEVSESARGSGLRRSLGELLVCPYCLSMWIATAMAAGFLVAPRLTRQVTSVLTAVFGADLLQLAYREVAE